ncbi:hypothetical protein EMIHUDRAFT_213202 [Emiliania huxleyi CCMP1516]|uniref:Uncharacterized protein n=2 Tax=Emiliania huxleyi TaxID=2903 RepID=A0A0D3INV7_EMIH1|nr:hypothetical protein EMIHUDRAFT_213202 [Emiliania huxleyi CCMP1516]EOD12942.1 hypothetical protein EMIHUDRAFT_213202 [Emiliania huxleyi CCMP1516]|eukprot:XP_005765371.1 hypothetical protein EMIHUDRAFT_213202 [Emiliania huxleyi CCMP1516]
MHEGVRKYPTVVRGALKVNGVGVGFDAEARAEIIMAQVKAQEDKLKVLERLTPLLGRQAAELYGRFACKPSTTFNHQARGNEPSISRDALVPGYRLITSMPMVWSVVLCVEVR